MSTAGPLLRDIHLPQVSWWPPAIGWWFLAALVLMVICSFVILVSRRRKRVRPRRDARRELDALAAQFDCEHNNAALAAGLSRLLRRIALAVEPAVVARHAVEWREFLQRRAPGIFDEAQLVALGDAPYRARPMFDAEALLAAGRKWCDVALRRA